MNILVVAPHADDEVLGCGGIMAKKIAEGNNLYIAIMSNAHIGAPELFSKESIENIRHEAIKAHHFLGVTKTFFFDFPAPRLETAFSYQISTELNNLLHTLQISSLYLPHRGDMHKDHSVIFYAGLVAARPINNCPVKEIYTYETLSETEWSAPFGSDVFIPNIFEPIKDHLEAKLEAMKFYKSQLKNFPHPRSIESLKNLAVHRGASVGVEAAEAFALIRKIAD